MFLSHFSANPFSLYGKGKAKANKSNPSKNLKDVCLVTQDMFGETRENFGGLTLYLDYSKKKLYILIYI